MQFSTYSSPIPQLVNTEYVENGIRLKLQLLTNRKSHMGFPLTPISMTLDDLQLL